MDIIQTIISFVIVLSIVVFIHEYGHYIVGKWRGIYATHFSIGFGPVIWSRQARDGTIWQIAALPLGGYVKFLGDADASSRSDPSAESKLSREDYARSFPAATVTSRALTVVAGPVANFILSCVIFAGLAFYTGEPKEPPTLQTMHVSGVDLQSGDIIRSINGHQIESFADIGQAFNASEKGALSYKVERDGTLLDVTGPNMNTPIIGYVVPLSPAEKAGVQAGDIVLALNETPIEDFASLKKEIEKAGEVSVTLKLNRAGEEIELALTPKFQDVQNSDGGFSRQAMIGITSGLPFDFATQSITPLSALGAGVSKTYDVIAMSLDGLRGMIVGEISPENLQGVIGIAQLSGSMAKSGLTDFIGLIAIISTAIGFLNLFPIPVLDGGHLAIFGYEALTGRQPNEKILGVLMNIGLSVVLFLMLFALYNDIMRL